MTPGLARAGLEPAAFWAHFQTLNHHPRPSRAEEPVIEQSIGGDRFTASLDGGRSRNAIPREAVAVAIEPTETSQQPWTDEATDRVVVSDVQPPPRA